MSEVIKAVIPVIPVKEMPKEFEILLRKNIKSKTLDDESFTYMSLMLTEDTPKNPKELF
mgnify:CR=1 FL=1